MIVTIICDILGNKNNGGLSVAVNNLIDFLSKRQHEVRVVCPDQDKINKKGFYIVPNINFYIFNEYIKKNGITIAKFDNSIVSKALEKSDIVYITTPFSLAKKVSKICKEKKIPCIFVFHVSNYFFCSKKK